VLFQNRRSGKKSEASPTLVNAEPITDQNLVKIPPVTDIEDEPTLKLRTVAVKRPFRISIRTINRQLPSFAAQWLVPLVLLYLLLRLMMGSSFLSTQRYFGSPGDTPMYMWFLGWWWHAIKLGQPLGFIRAFDFPYATNIMDYASVPALALLFGWLTAFTSIVFVYNLLVVVNYTLIFVFGTLTLRVLGISRVFSIIGGFLFCLMPYLTVQGLQHLNLVFIGPLFILSYLIARLITSAVQPSWIIGAFTGLALLLAFYTSLETLLTAAFCILVVYGCALFYTFSSTYQFTLRLLNPRFLLGVGAPLILTIPGLLNFVHGVGSQSSITDAGLTKYSSDALSFVIPTQFYLIHTFATTVLSSQFRGNIFEKDGYLSLLFIIVFIVYATRGWHKALIRILASATVIMAVCSLGPVFHLARVPVNIYMPWSLMLHLPLIRDALPGRLALYVAYLGIIVVIWGSDQWAKRTPIELHPFELRGELVINVALLGLVLLFWLPLLPSFTASIPKAASILSTDQVVPRYIGQEPTMVLDAKEPDNGFCVSIGILAASDNYQLMAPNSCTFIELPGNADWRKIDTAFLQDTDGKTTSQALRQYLPQMGVGRVMFLSVNDQPISSQQLSEISQLLGNPLYDNQGLVVVWSVPPNIG
jgi:hypothetical protein